MKPSSKALQFGEGQFAVVDMHAAEFGAAMQGRDVLAGVEQAARVEGRLHRVEQAALDDGVLKAGQALPSERRLCEKLGISRSALREGLRVLRGRGIIETAQGRGSFVAQLSDKRDASPLMRLFNSQPRTLYDLLEVRALLEGESARLAALRGTDADFVLLRRRYEEMLAAPFRTSRTPTRASTRAWIMPFTWPSARPRTESGAGAHPAVAHRPDAVRPCSPR
ncbi:hypothetical protein SSTU70S_04698 [Stutzerimonas stutzeri]